MLRKQFKIVLSKLLHEALIGFDFSNGLTQNVETILKLDALLANEVGQDEGGTSALSLN